MLLNLKLLPKKSRSDQTDQYFFCQVALLDIYIMQHLHSGNLMRFLEGTAEPELETGAPDLESVTKWKIIENMRRNLKTWLFSICF